MFFEKNVFVFFTIFLFAFFTIFLHGLHALATVTKNDVAQYLMNVGQLTASKEQTNPNYYMNHALDGWNSTDPRVQQLVGLVCEAFIGKGNDAFHVEVGKGCAVYESMAATYLLRFYESRQRQNRYPRESMVRFQMSYHTVVVYYSSVKEMMPVICKRSRRYLIGLNDITTPDMIPQLLEEGNNLANDTIQYLKRSHLDRLRSYRNKKYPSVARPGGMTSLTLVKPMIPWMCDHYFNKITWRNIQRPCEFFINETRAILEFVADTIATAGVRTGYSLIAGYNKNGTFRICHGKHFIARHCRSLSSQHPWNAACRYLLKEHMELLMKEGQLDTPEYGLEEEEEEEPMEEEDLWEEFERYLQD